MHVHKPYVRLSGFDRISDPAAVDGDAKGINVAPRAGCEYLTHPLGLAIDEMDLVILEKQQLLSGIRVCAADPSWVISVVGIGHERLRVHT